MNCFYCGILTQKRKDNQPDTRTRDHLTPKSRGGGGSPKNIVIACRKCNGDKGGLTLEEYRAVISLRFGSPVKFWGEGHVAVPVQRETVPVAPRQPKPMRLPGALLVVASKFRPVADAEPQHKRKLVSHELSGDHSWSAREPLWDNCPKLSAEGSSHSDLTGCHYANMVVMGVISGVKSNGRFAVKCRCGRFTARSHKAIINPANDKDMCTVCYHERRIPFPIMRWEDDGGIAA